MRQSMSTKEVKKLIMEKFQLSSKEVSYQQQNRMWVYINKPIALGEIKSFCRDIPIDLGGYYSDDYCDREYRHYTLGVKHGTIDKQDFVDKYWKLLDLYISNGITKQYDLCRRLASDNVIDGMTAIEYHDLFWDVFRDLGFKNIDYTHESLLRLQG